MKKIQQHLLVIHKQMMISMKIYMKIIIQERKGKC